MINLRIGTNTQRKTIIVEGDRPLNEILEEEEINVQGAALHLDGSLIPGCDTDNSLFELGIADGSNASLIAVVKADSAK